jgi:ribosomal protein S18 acetylase RimI-like enzyme
MKSQHGMTRDRTAAGEPALLSGVEGDVAARARAWRNAGQAAVCDVIEPWEHGTILRATGHPSYFDLNVVRVEDDPGMSVDELTDVTDRALADLPHRRLDFDLAEAGDRLRAGFEAAGWRSERLLWMRHEGSLPAGPEITVEEVAYDDVHDLRVAWHLEDFPDLDPAGYHAEAREVALSRGVRVLAVRDGRAPVAFAQLERDGGAAEITQVYVHPDHRGGGRGTAMTRAAIQAASDATDLWIVADDEGRPKHLYARLGFRPAWTMLEFLRPPAAT